MSTLNEPAEETLRRLYADGRLVDCYPTVAGLLSELDGPALRRAGALLSRLDTDEVLASHPTLAAVTIEVTGSSTLEPLVAPLTAELGRHGMLPRIRLDAPAGPAGAPPVGGVGAGDAEVRLHLLDANAVFERLPLPWGVPDVERVAGQTAAALEQAARAHRSGVLVLNTVPLPYVWLAQLVDHTSRARLGMVWRAFNSRILALGADHPDVVVIDLDPLAAETRLRDPRTATYARVQFSDELLGRYAREVGHLVRARRGRTSKCLVLDLDGTLWHGTLSEDGAEGIQAAGGYAGEAYRGFQRMIKQIAAQGVLLAVSSKNDDADVREVLRSHPEMTLREDDFVAIAANWGAKPDAIAAIAARVGIGADSLVFVDDNPTERGLVRSAMPEVIVVGVDAEEPALHAERLVADGWFTTGEVTDEDRARSELYRAESRRAEFRERAGSTDYLAELGLEVELFPPADGELARLAQLTQRTNQFNLTTRRLDLATVRTLAADPAALVLAVRSRDRFGENGVVGAILGHWQERELVLDNVMLSCRVLDRGVESACLREVLRYAAGSGARRVRASYRPTAKNARVRDLYPRHGFQTVHTGAEEVLFEHDLDSLPPQVPHIALSATFGRTSPAEPVAGG